jgi:hypothetical protein
MNEMDRRVEVTTEVSVARAEIVAENLQRRTAVNGFKLQVATIAIQPLPRHASRAGWAAGCTSARAVAPGRISVREEARTLIPQGEQVRGLRRMVKAI